MPKSRLADFLTFESQETANWPLFQIRLLKEQLQSTGGFPIQGTSRLGRNDGGCSRVCSSQGKEMNDVGMIKIEDFKC